MDENIINCFVESFKEMFNKEIEELVKLYGKDEEKIQDTIKEKFKYICDIKFIE